MSDAADPTDAIATGCTDPDACNYDELAVEDDGSCYNAEEGFDCNGECLEGDTVPVTMFDAFGDGWNGNTISVGDQPATLETGESVCRILPRYVYVS